MELREIIAFALFFSLDGDGVEDVSHQYQRWQDIFKPGLNQEHSGDCLQEPWTCLRCLIEDIYKEADIITNLFKEKGDKG
jgi:hypothetical protein